MLKRLPSWETNAHQWKNRSLSSRECNTGLSAIFGVSLTKRANGPLVESTECGPLPFASHSQFPLVAQNCKILWLTTKREGGHILGLTKKPGAFAIAFSCSAKNWVNRAVAEG